VRVTDTPGWTRANGTEVSAIITLHNYGRFVRDAIESALASEGVRIEVIVVDDRSTDDGAVVVRALMGERPEAAIRLVEQRVNTGVQRARNLAFSHARSPYAFVLDADNLVYPGGIAKLRDALVADPQAAFAYGIIERFSDDGATGLMGLEGWDERRLARSHYIDAMAVVDVGAWREVGGYVTDPALELGWEDYDLWLSFASHGYRGTHVREIVGRYRVHGISSLAITTLDTSELMGRLQARHARFFREAGGRHG
jgi:glycosyltransferase involved in cell wall biosynthesis